MGSWLHVMLENVERTHCYAGPIAFQCQKKFKMIFGKTSYYWVLYLFSCVVFL